MNKDILSLKWNNYQVTFFHTMSNLLLKGSYADVTLACDGKFFPVHKLILAACSDYFSEIFEGISCKSPVVILKDISVIDVEYLLSYMYLGEVQVKKADLPSLVEAAKCLQIKGLALPDEDPSNGKNTFSEYPKASDECPEARNEDTLSSRSKSVDSKFKDTLNNGLITSIKLENENSQDEEHFVKIEENPFSASTEIVNKDVFQDFVGNSQEMSKDDSIPNSDCVAGPSGLQKNNLSCQDTELSLSNIKNENLGNMDSEGSDKPSASGSNVISRSPPNSSQHTVSRASIETYPHPGEGLPITDAITSWKKPIGEKFLNSRKRVATDLAVVKAQKKKRKTYDLTFNAFNSNDQFRVKRFDPIQACNDDEETIKTYISWMKIENQKIEQDTEQISHLLEKTFMNRKLLIYLHMAKVSRVKEQFPCLFYKREILKEYERISALRLEARMQFGVAIYSDAILDTCEASLMKKKITDSMSAVDDEHMKQAIKVHGSFILLPQMLGENFAHLGIEESKVEDMPKHPCFVYSRDLLTSSNGNIKIYVDRRMICENMCTILDAVTILIAVYDIFSISYPKVLKSTLRFIKSVFLNRSIKGNPPPRFVSVLKQVEAYIK